MKARYPFDDLVLFTQHVASAMRLGVPLHQTVELLAGEMSNRRFQKALAGVAKRLRSGDTFHSSLAKFPHAFPEYYLRVLSVGEKSGTLPDTMEHLASLVQHSFVLGQKLKKAFAYPMLVFFVMMTLGFLYTGWVLPQMNEVLTELAAGIEYLGAGTVPFSFAAEYSLYIPAFMTGIAVLLVVTFFLAHRFARAGWCGLVFDRFDLNFPFLGVLTRCAIASRLTRSLSLVLRCGVPLPEALGLCADMLENKAARKSILAAKANVVRGETLGAAMLSESIFPPTMVWMLSAAEVRGDFLGALDQLADFYSTKVETASVWLLEILEPLLIVAIGLLFILLAASIYGPIFTIMNVADVVG